MMTGKDQIFADGKSVTFIWDMGKQQTAFTMNDPMVVRMDVANPCLSFESVNVFDSDDELTIRMPQEPVRVNVEFAVLPENFIQEHSDDGSLMLNLDLFANLSVSDMFRVINAKLNKREKS
jgi:hypothetical protein